MTKKTEALRLLEECLKELESKKGAVFAATQKLSRAAILLDNNDVQIWCAIQLGDSRYVAPLNMLLEIASRDDLNSDKNQTDLNEAFAKVEKLGLQQKIHYTHEELNQKSNKSGGGYVSIGFVEEQYADLVRRKRGNDGTYYANGLYSHISYVRQRAHDFASTLFNQLKFSGTVSNSFDILKNAVDDKLLDLSPVLAEQLMLAFRGVSSSKDEEWSQALTTCRRLLEGIADQLFPANSEPVKGRVLGQTQYVNRLWAFMDKAIQSESNRDLAKTHVDFLGAWLEKTNKITNKGVHAEVEQLEAVKAVFHTYLVVADVLGYLGSGQVAKSKPNLNSATMDELEALLDINRATAKEIIKARVQHGQLDRALLSKVHGVGPKTMDKAIAVFAV